MVKKNYWIKLHIEDFREYFIEGVQVGDYGPFPVAILRLELDGDDDICGLITGYYMNFWSVEHALKSMKNIEEEWDKRFASKRKISRKEVRKFMGEACDYIINEFEVEYKKYKNIEVAYCYKLEYVQLNESNTWKSKSYPYKVIVEALSDEQMYMLFRLDFRYKNIKDAQREGELMKSIWDDMFQGRIKLKSTEVQQYMSIIDEKFSRLLQAEAFTVGC